MEILQLSCHEEKYVAVGVLNNIQLMRVPSFEIIQTFSNPSAKSFQRILQLLDGVSFMGGSSNGMIIRWYKDVNSNKAIDGFKYQVFEALADDDAIRDLLQMRHDPRKLVSRNKSKVIIWDIETTAVLYIVPNLGSTSTLFELGDSGFFVSLLWNSELSVWDLRGEGKLQSVLNRKFDRATQLRNGNILLSYTHKRIVFFEEHQVVRSVSQDNSRYHLLNMQVNRKSLTTLCCMAIGRHWTQYDEAAMVNVIPSELYSLCHQSRGEGDNLSSSNNNTHPLSIIRR